MEKKHPLAAFVNSPLLIGQETTSLHFTVLTPNSITLILILIRFSFPWFGANLLKWTLLYPRLFSITIAQVCKWPEQTTFLTFLLPVCVHRGPDCLCVGRNLRWCASIKETGGVRLKKGSSSKQQPGRFGIGNRNTLLAQHSVLNHNQWHTWYLTHTPRNIYLCYL